MSFGSQKQAEAVGKELIKGFQEGWTLKVWENLGWHISFDFGKYVHVYYDPKSDSFSALIGGEHGGKPEWTNHFSSKDPGLVIFNALKYAREQMTENERIYQECRKSITNANDLPGWSITNIRRGKGVRRHLIYAELRNDKNELIISATLDYIEQRIKQLLPTPKE